MTLRLSPRLIPFLVVIVSLLALMQLYGAVMLAFGSKYAFAALYALFGFAGFVLARALWNHRAKIASGSR